MKNKIFSNIDYVEMSYDKAVEKVKSELKNKYTAKYVDGKLYYIGISKNGREKTIEEAYRTLKSEINTEIAYIFKAIGNYIDNKLPVGNKGENVMTIIKSFGIFISTLIKRECECLIKIYNNKELDIELVKKELWYGSDYDILKKKVEGEKDENFINEFFGRIGTIIKKSIEYEVIPELFGIPTMEEQREQKASQQKETLQRTIDECEKAIKECEEEYGTGYESIFAKENDSNIDHPQHYNHGGVETIDKIKTMLTSEEFKGFLKGNIIKYIDRADYKGHKDEDLGKADWYLRKLKEEEK